MRESGDTVDDKVQLFYSCLGEQVGFCPCWSSKTPGSQVKEMERLVEECGGEGVGGQLDHIGEVEGKGGGPDRSYT